MPDFDIIGQGISGGQPSGLFKGLDPAYQGQQLALAQARAFQNGVPTDPATGGVDYGAAANRLMQLGDYQNADKLLQTGVQMQGLGMARQAMSSFGSGGSGTAAPTQAAAADGAASGGDSLGIYAYSIGSMESGNDYQAVGQKTQGGDRAYGRFQVMGSNVGPWTKQVLGQEMTPDQFLASPDAQDAVFRAKFGGYVQQYGNPMDAASMWFSGKPLARAGNASDVLGTTVPAYVQKFAAGLAPAAAAMRGGPQPSTPQATPAASVASPPQAAAASASPQPGPAPAQASQVVGPNDPVPDSLYQTALRVVGQARTMDPRSFTPQEQQAVSRAQALVAQYQGQNGGGASTSVQTAQKGTDDGPATTGQHPFAQQPQPQVSPPVAPSTVTGPAAQPAQPGSPSAVAPPPPPMQPPPAALFAGGVPASQPAALGSGNTPLMNDPGVAGILRNFQGGRYVNDPGAGLIAMRQLQMGLGFGGQMTSPAAQAIGKTADYLEQAITRSATLTNEQRNARDPAVIADLARRQQVEQGARLAADTDPSRITFAQNQAAAAAQGKLDVDSSPQALRAAGQRAEATAAGTQQGNNSAAAIGARASNAAAVAEATQSGDALGKLPAQYAAAATAATKQNAIVSDMLDQATQFNMGANADREQALNATMSDLGHRMGVDTSDIDGKVAAYQQYVKLGGNLTRQAMKDTGGRTGGIQEMQFIANTLPSPSTSPDGFKGVAAFLQGSNDYDIAKQQAADAYAKANGSLRGFEGSFTGSVSPAATLLHRLQQDQPAMFQTTVARLRQSPAGQAVLRKAASGLQYLGSMGVGG